METLLAIALIVFAAALRPWRLLARSSLHSPLIALTLVLPVVWTLPLRQDISLNLQWSGACLVALCLGWPLATLTLAVVGVLTWALSQAPTAQVIELTVWHGLVPATLSAILGGLLRRYAPHHAFVYVIGRAFLGTVFCLFLSNLLADGAGHPLPKVGIDVVWVAQWLMAWGDAIVTGMLVTIFVAYRPQWLATWSDKVYLTEPPAQDSDQDPQDPGAPKDPR